MRRIPPSGKWRQLAEISAPQILQPQTLCRRFCVSMPRLNCKDREEQTGIPLRRFLEIRASLAPGQLVRRVIVARMPRRSVHVRLPLRKAGDYPVAIFSLAVTLDAAGVVTSASAAVGSVEAAARRWRELEAELIGHPLDPARAAEKAEHHCAALRASRRCRGAGMVSRESSSQSRAQSRKRVAQTVVSDKIRTSMRCRCD